MNNQESNAFLLVAEYITTCYVAIKQLYGPILTERQLFLATATLNSNNWIESDILSYSDMEVSVENAYAGHITGLSFPHNYGIFSSDKIDILINLILQLETLYFIHEPDMANLSIEDMAMAVLSQKEEIDEFVRKIIAKEPNAEIYANFLILANKKFKDKTFSKFVFGKDIWKDVKSGSTNSEKYQPNNRECGTPLLNINSISENGYRRKKGRVTEDKISIRDKITTGIFFAVIVVVIVLIIAAFVINKYI